VGTEHNFVDEGSVGGLMEFDETGHAPKSTLQAPRLVILINVLSTQKLQT
jgi:hypothetical protein